MATASFRTHLVSELGEVELGTSVKLAGWVAFRRRHKRVEVGDGRVEVLAPAATLPFAVEGSGEDTEARRRWRYLDMRRQSARRHLLFRARLPDLPELPRRVVARTSPA
jgi:aspartyl-tRNA synthetase